jgi:uncharacterized protein (DUF934 family)
MDGWQVVSPTGEKADDPNGTGTVVLTLQAVLAKDAEVVYQVDTTNVGVPLEGAHTPSAWHMTFSSAQ